MAVLSLLNLVVLCKPYPATTPASFYGSWACVCMCKQKLVTFMNIKKFRADP